MASMNHGGRTSAGAILTKPQAHVCSGSFTSFPRRAGHVRYPPIAANGPAHAGTINKLSRATGIAPSMVSRQLGDIGSINRYHQPGRDLVSTRSDILDRRFNRTRLTPRGRALAGQVLKAMGKGVDPTACCTGRTPQCLNFIYESGTGQTTGN
jgi:hypothetical protein